ncbi:winged helix-turn-helix domain-containing protein [Phenylobacterium sp.]|uniref:ATP-binding protein n=1 Tax=Phenylobacterium sp. TaxID=1871053 RepID=UPI00121E109A|nr:winged helix-turn-helix domain-containing protein [Phenylobacterium sp.]THD60579.1 MAG: transcriptional regulator [Phenylobacterium sp.]
MTLDDAEGLAEAEGQRFGTFVAVASRRALLQSGEVVHLGDRAFDILLALLARRGDFVARDDLVAAVWPDRLVGDAALRVHISHLRKALGADPCGASWIVHVPGRGYALAEVASDAGGVSRCEAAGGDETRQDANPNARVFGREPILKAITDNLASRQLTTLVGPGGVGKTTVAAEVVRRVRDRFDTTVEVDLSVVVDPPMLIGALAASLQIGSPKTTSLSALIAAVRDREVLILLNSCEHLVAAVAEVAELMLRQAPRLRILATSRQALRAEGEWVRRVEPLDVPPPGAALTPAAALGFGAIELFVARANCQPGGYVLAPDDVVPIAEICRRLEGIPLAIELAAARLDRLELLGLGQSLDDGLGALSDGLPGVAPRHQTLNATLDWSYRDLTPDEQMTLRALSVFRGFSAQAAADLLQDEAVNDVSQTLMSLVAKSLVVAHLAADGTDYRLLDITRAYAHAKLEEAGEIARRRRRHAEIFKVVADRSEAEWARLPTTAWVETYAGDVPNFRLALDWAFSADGDAETAVGLTVALIPLFLQLSLVEECLNHVQAAISRLGRLRTDTRQARLKLSAALGWKPAGRTTEDQAASDLVETLAIATELGDVDYRLRCYWGLWLNAGNAARPAEALDFADAFIALADQAGEPNERLVGERMRARSLMLLGRLRDARLGIDRVLADYVAPPNRSHIVRYHHEQTLNARVIHSRLRWLMGNPIEAYADLRETVAAAEALGHGLTLAYVLADGACPLALAAGDFENAERYIGDLRREAETLGVAAWAAYSRGFHGELLHRQGNPAAGAESLRAAIRELTDLRFTVHRSAFSAALAAALLDTGAASEAGAVLEAELAEAAVVGDAWHTPELLRLRSRARIADLGRDGLAEARSDVIHALALSHAQGALTWERRAQVELAALTDLKASVSRRGALTERASRPAPASR